MYRSCAANGTSLEDSCCRHTPNAVTPRLKAPAPKASSGTAPTPCPRSRRCSLHHALLLRHSRTPRLENKTQQAQVDGKGNLIHHSHERVPEALCRIVLCSTDSSVLFYFPIFLFSLFSLFFYPL
eukprot:SAG11_NODE_300_length_11057_cov_5.223469_7_plen_125_part_00